MCCCCFKRHGWCYCWFIVAASWALPLIGVCLAIYGIFGGPVPTQTFEDGTIVLLFSNGCAIFVCAGAMVCLVKRYQHIAIYIVMVVLLVTINCLGLFVVYAMTKSNPSVEEVSDYTMKYARSHNGEAPPFLEYFQKQAPCCGGAGFMDLVLKTPQMHGENFSVPQSCCFREGSTTKPGPNCGKDLNFTIYNNSAWAYFHLNKFLAPALKMSETEAELQMQLEADFTMELTESVNATVQYLLMNDMIPNNTVIGWKLTYRELLPQFVVDYLEDYVARAQVDSRQRKTEGLSSADIVKNNLTDDIKRLKKEFNIKKDLPISVYGCATAIQILREIKVLPQYIREAFHNAFIGLLAITIVQALLLFACLIIYNYYYWTDIKRYGESGLYPAPGRPSQAGLFSVMPFSPEISSAPSTVATGVSEDAPASTDGLMGMGEPGVESTTGDTGGLMGAEPT